MRCDGSRTWAARASTAHGRNAAPATGQLHERHLNLNLLSIGDAIAQGACARARHCGTRLRYARLKGAIRRCDGHAWAASDLASATSGRHAGAASICNARAPSVACSLRVAHRNGDFLLHRGGCDSEALATGMRRLCAALVEVEARCGRVRCSGASVSSIAGRGGRLSWLVGGGGQRGCVVHASRLLVILLTMLPLSAQTRDEEPEAAACDKDRGDAQADAHTDSGLDLGRETRSRTEGQADG